ncbi:MAG TPA: carbon storage regulator CsrA [Longimicrobiales bacterium]|nr:carbon storage regulator CsrA [Longimicrobiales bacterium]
MLILSRKPGDAILIDGGIRLVVLSIDSGSVRLGIEAPASVGIVREEVAARIAEENRRAGVLPAGHDMVEGLRPDRPGD